MKTQRTLLLIALLAACNVMAQEQQTEQQNTVSSEAATTTVGELNFHWLAPDQQPANLQNDREPVEGLSPQSWTTISGWYPGRSVFPDDETSTTEMPLLWFGHEPWQ